MVAAPSAARGLYVMNLQTLPTSFENRFHRKGRLYLDTGLTCVPEESSILIYPAVITRQNSGCCGIYSFYPPYSVNTKMLKVGQFGFL